MASDTPTHVLDPASPFSLDDQDQVLGASFPLVAEAATATPMPRTKALIADKGVVATSFYIHTP